MYYNTTRLLESIITRHTTHASTHKYKTHKKCILEININNTTNTGSTKHKQLVHTIQTIDLHIKEDKIIPDTW